MTGKFEFRLCSNGYNYLWKDGELFVTEKGDYIILEQDKDDITDLISGLSEENQKLKQFQNKVYSTLDEEIKYKQGILELAEEQELEGSITKTSFELSTLKIMRTKFKKIEDEE